MVLCLATEAMGTRFEIVLGGDDPQRLRPLGEAALAEIEDWDLWLSLFARDSFLAHINREAHAAPVPLDDDTYELLATCRQVHEASQGAFDVTVAPLMRRWGFHERPPVAGEAEETADPVYGMTNVDLDDEQHTIRFRRAGISLDLGAIGKGFALDRAAALLRGAAVECALLHGGTSTVVALGAPPGQAGWEVAIAGSSRVVTLRDRALSVSSATGRTVERDGERLGHILDPRTGRSCDGGSLAAVIAASAGLADAWSTALLVLDDFPPLFPDTLSARLEPDRERGPERHFFHDGESRQIHPARCSRPEL